MSASPTTRSSLLLRIRQQDALAWHEFVEIYAPLVHAYGRHHGLQDADAADLAQEVLQAVHGACNRFEYDPERGSFRGWLFTITRNKLRNFRARRERHGPVGAADTAVREMLEQQPDPASQEEVWNDQHQARLFEWAAGRIRPGFQDSTWQAFWQTSVAGRPAADVARQLRLSVGAVYIAKSRVLARLREQIQAVEAEGS